MYGKYSRVGYDGGRTVVQILVQAHFELVSSVLAQEATELVLRSASSFARLRYVA